jgi:hypothetical protein
MEFLPLLLLPFLIVALIVQGICMLISWIADGIRERHAARYSRDESSHHLTSDGWRQSLLATASELGMDAHEARVALIRESLDAAKRGSTVD